MSKPENALILLSGGLDSTTTLAIAKSRGLKCFTLSFDYGQRHKSELNAATKIAKNFTVAEHKTTKIHLDDIGGSALTDKNIQVPKFKKSTEIPLTYVPARNTIFLAFALGFAEILNCHKIFIGVNVQDYSGYPDCRPAYIKAFETMANLATKSAIEGQKITIETPLIKLNKAEIIQKGVSLGVDYATTISCYQATENGAACGICDACTFRKLGFKTAKITDPTKYF